MRDLLSQWIHEFESFVSLQGGVDPTEHRPKLDAPIFPGACVCRRVDRKEVKANQAAEKAMQQEWGRLRPRKAWGESNPNEWEEVATEARDAKEEVHFGVAFGFVVEKNTSPFRG